MIPVYSLVAFSAWTLAILIFTVGVYRWFNIIFRGHHVGGFSATEIEGSPFYKRAMRAHANALETLPVFGAIVLATVALHIQTRWLDVLSIATIGGRVVHSMIHLSTVQTDRVVSVRFTFLSVQLVAMLGMIGIIVRNAI
jgi:uncharacterized MAPEG superfamily protein